MRMKKIKDLCGDNAMHLEPRQGTREQARSYCMKKDTQVDEPVEFGTWEVSPGKRLDLTEARALILAHNKVDELYKDPALDHIMTRHPRWAERVLSTKAVAFTVDIELRPWQEEVLALLQGEPVHRRIIWIWSHASNTGKTTFKDYVSLMIDTLPACGKIEDILYAYDLEKIIWFDFTRAQNGFESYHCLEMLSNIGFKLSTKYTSTKKFVNAHIVVTSNHAPDEGKLPQRFTVINID